MFIIWNLTNDALKIPIKDLTESLFSLIFRLEIHMENTYNFVFQLKYIKKKQCYRQWTSIFRRSLLFLNNETRKSHPPIHHLPTLSLSFTVHTAASIQGRRDNRVSWIPSLNLRINPSQQLWYFAVVYLTLTMTSCQGCRACLPTHLSNKIIHRHKTYPYLVT